MNDEFYVLTNIDKKKFSSLDIHPTIERHEREVNKLKEELQEYVFLDRHIKEENENLMV